jgi:hypothetical protein
MGHVPYKIIVGRRVLRGDAQALRIPSTLLYANAFTDV